MSAVAEFGFCYVADCDPYIDEALRSIATLREQMPDVPVAMVAPRDLFREGTPVTHWVELEQTRKGPIIKTDAWLAPFERVAFIDSDTLIIGDMTHLFALLSRFDLAFAVEPNGRPDRGVDSGVPIAFQEPNSGFFLFRKSPQTRALFNCWIEEFDALNAAHGVTANQPSLRNALWKCEGVRQLVIGHEYNLIPHASCGVSQPVAVVHDRSPERFRLAATANRHAGPRAIVAGLGEVHGFLGRRDWIRQFARLAWRFAYVLVRPRSVDQQAHPKIWWRDGVD